MAFLWSKANNFLGLFLKYIRGYYIYLLKRPKMGAFRNICSSEEYIL